MEKVFYSWFFTEDILRLFWNIAIFENKYLRGHDSFKGSLQNP